MADVTPEVGVAMAERLGVASSLQPVLAAVLGSEDVTVLDMAAAYSTNRPARHLHSTDDGDRG